MPRIGNFNFDFEKIKCDKNCDGYYRPNINGYYTCDICKNSFYCPGGDNSETRRTVRLKVIELDKTIEEIKEHLQWDIVKP